jgi:hypothetical protein
MTTAIVDVLRAPLGLRLPVTKWNPYKHEYLGPQFATVLHLDILGLSTSLQFCNGFATLLDDLFYGDKTHEFEYSKV